MHTSLLRSNGVSIPASLFASFSIEAGSVVRYQERKGQLFFAIDNTAFGLSGEIVAAKGGFIQLDSSTMASLSHAVGSVLDFFQIADGLVVADIVPKDKALRSYQRTIGVDGMPLPPEWLVESFIGVPDAQNYFNSGLRTWRWMEEKLAEHGSTLEKGATVFDFGCGCGRVSRHIDNRLYDLLGCDLHSLAIEWVSEYLNGGKYMCGFESPPLPVEQSSVDFLFAISVLTHLDEEMQVGWLKEWHRVIKPGGFLFATFNGDDFVSLHLSRSGEYYESIARQFAQNSGFAFMADQGWKGVFPDFYQTAYHEIRYVKEVWSDLFHIVELVPSGGFTNKQNMAILQKR